MYNIFKPHIVEKNGMYAIRKMSFGGWVKYGLAQQEDYWWMTNPMWCYTNSEEKVREIFNTLTENSKWRRVK